MLISMEHGSSKSRRQEVTADIPTCGTQQGKMMLKMILAFRVYCIVEMCYTFQHREESLFYNVFVTLLRRIRDVLDRTFWVYRVLLWRLRALHAICKCTCAG